MSQRLTPTTVTALCDAGLDPAYVTDLVRRTLAEDLGGTGFGGTDCGETAAADITSAATINATQRDSAIIVARAPGVVAGLPVASAVFDVAGGGQLEWSPRVTDGSGVVTGDVLATVTGLTRPLLGAERSALNLLCRTSGIATHTRAWVEAVAEYPVTILDTRKTTPGLRALEKYAGRCGGGSNKRMGLFDVAMIKDNHKRAAGGITAAFRAVAANTDAPIQVEVATVAEALEAVAIG
ncbi:MAG: nicotinate-nucleotide diphosphorylase, partial [Mycobacteriales bacterium]